MRTHFPDLSLQVLEDGKWMDVSTKAKSATGMVRVYKRMCKGSPKGPPYGMRIITIHAEHLGRVEGAGFDNE